MLVAVVLTESIVTEQHRVACQVSHHAVRPVQHWCFDKNELFAVTDIQRVASFHHIKIPLRMMVMTIYRVDSVGSTVDRRIGNLRHQFGQRPGVVLFCMVNHDVIDIRQIDFITQVLHKFAAEFMVDGCSCCRAAFYIPCRENHALPSHVDPPNECYFSPQ